MRYTKKVSMWPVGLVTKYGLSSPIVRNKKLDGFYDGWIGGRKYPVDMAGFAVNVKFFLNRPKAAMPYKPGYEEDGFLKSLAPLNNTEIELLASQCTEVCSLILKIFGENLNFFVNIGPDVAYTNQKKSASLHPRLKEIQWNEFSKITRYDRMKNEKRFSSEISSRNTEAYLKLIKKIKFEYPPQCMTKRSTDDVGAIFL